MQTPVINKHFLLQQLTANSNNIKSFGVKQLGLFGSFAKDSAIHAYSDVDLLVEFEQDKKTYDNFMELSFYLEELLGRKVELVTKQSLSKYIGPHILKQVQNVAL
jgi:uncharacterized protein